MALSILRLIEEEAHKDHQGDVIAIAPVEVATFILNEKRKHISDIEKKITFNHPMTQEHYIEFVEIISKDLKHIKRKHFSFDDELEMTIKCNCKNGFDVRLYCNRDGVWKTEIN